MSRSGYEDDCDDPLVYGRYYGQLNSAIRGKRGQAFLREMAAALDAMPTKELIADELVDDDGDCCALGAVCVSRGLNVSSIDPECPESVGAALGIAHQMAAEIEYQNDECGERYERDKAGLWRLKQETPAERWQRMRQWVASKILG